VPPTVKKGSAARQEEIKLALQKAKDMDSSATAIIDITNSTEVRDGEKQSKLYNNYTHACQHLVFLWLRAAV